MRRSAFRFGATQASFRFGQPSARQTWHAAANVTAHARIWLSAEKISGREISADLESPTSPLEAGQRSCRLLPDWPESSCPDPGATVRRQYGDQKGGNDLSSGASTLMPTKPRAFCVALDTIPQHRL